MNNNPRMCKHDGELIYAAENIGVMRYCTFCEKVLCLTSEGYCSKDCARANVAITMLSPDQEAIPEIISHYPAIQLAIIDRSKMS